MIKCKLCGKEFIKKRAAHGHFMTAHGAEYAAAGHSMAKLVEYIDELPPVDAGIDNRPDGLRHLNVSDPEERAARSEVDENGENFEYIDSAGFCYTPAEVKAKRWI